MKNVTISVEDSLLIKSREFARLQGKSFNELVRDVLRQTVEDSSVSATAVFQEADRLGWRISGPLPTREERNAR